MVRALRKIWECLSSFILAIAGVYSVLPETIKIKQYGMDLITEHPNSNAVLSYFFIGFGVSACSCMIYDFYKEKKFHRLKYGSKKFYDFFSKWYSQQGDLTVICYDLDWIVSEDGKDERVLTALKTKAKSGKLNIILKKDVVSNHKYEDLLAESGAKIYYNSGSLLELYSFSSLSQMGNDTIIARKKGDGGNGYIKFRDIDNIYVTGLLNNLINNLKQEGVKT